MAWNKIFRMTHRTRHTSRHFTKLNNNLNNKMAIIPVMMSGISTIPNSDLSFPSICIPHAKMYIGKGYDSPMTRAFIESAFSRYGDVAEVVMVIHSADIHHHHHHRDHHHDHDQYDVEVEEYYRVFVHFKRWHIENGEARYVRSVLMSNSPNANIKLSYSGGPWYWKFSANKTQHQHYSQVPKLRLQLE